MNTLMNHPLTGALNKLYEKTTQRIKLLECAGYNVVFIWESDFKNAKTQSSSYNSANSGKNGYEAVCRSPIPCVSTHFQRPHWDE